MTESENEDLDFDGEEPEVQDPYKVLQIDRSATSDQIKSAYRKLALKTHPDKVSADQKEEAHKKFQEVAFAHAILSDPIRRKRYDETGSTHESIAQGDDGFSWSQYYREQFAEAVSDDAIRKFAAKYKGSDEEKDDLLIAYETHEGDMDQVYESVMLSNVLEDDNRFRKIIDAAIASKDVKGFKAYTSESKRSKNARVKAAKDEANEAEDYAQELGVHEKLFGSKGGKKNKKESSEDGLAALIRRNQEGRAGSFLEQLEAKYGGKTKKGKKPQIAEGPSEEEFQAAAARLKKRKDTGGDTASPASRKMKKTQK